MSLKSVLYPALLLTALCGGCSSNPASDAATTQDLTSHGGDLAASPDLTTAALQNIPATATAAGEFKTLLQAVTAAGLATTLSGPGPFTVFAPTDTAFAKLPTFLVPKLITAPYKTELTFILEYHVLSGKTLAASLLGKTQMVKALDGAELNIDGTGGKVVIDSTVNVTTPDVMATNGVIHIIDGVLLPTIVDTAVGYNDGTNTFNTLVTAVTAAGLGDTLAGNVANAGPFTVFAPTDAAFTALKNSIGAANFNAILANKAELTKLLEYHVLSTPVYAENLTNGQQAATLEGDKLTVGVANGAVTITDSTNAKANVILDDIPTRNGVIHVIDKVLLPPGI